MSNDLSLPPIALPLLLLHLLCSDGRENGSSNLWTTIPTEIGPVNDSFYSSAFQENARSRSSGP